MKRRGFFGILASAATGVAVIGFKASGGFGFVDVARWRSLGLYGSHRVFVNGRDVTDDSFQFNDREGWVKVFKRNANGQHYLNIPASSDGFYHFKRNKDGKICQHPEETPTVAQETIYGRIEIVRAKESRTA